MTEQEFDILWQSDLKSIAADYAIRRVCRERDDADDFTSDVYLYIRERIHKFNPLLSDIKTWCHWQYKAVHSKWAREQIRDRDRCPFEESAENPEVMTILLDIDLSSEVMAIEARMDGLDNEDRLIVILMWQGSTQLEISEAVHRDVKYVAERIRVLKPYIVGDSESAPKKAV